MKLSARSAVLSSALLAGALVLSACGKSEDQQKSGNAPAAANTAPTPPASAPAPAATASKPAAPASAAPAPAATAQQPAPAPAPAPAAADTIKVTGVTLGNAVGADHKVGKPKTSFATNDKAIYATVATDGTSPGATISAKWSYLEGSAPTVISDIGQSVSTDGPAVTTFKVQNPNEWPEGKYKVDISLNGKPVNSTDFDIKKH